MRFSICAARDKGFQTAHVTVASTAGVFGMFGSRTLCGLQVRKIFKGIDPCEATCWQCQTEMRAVQIDIERLRNVRNAVLSIFR